MASRRVSWSRPSFMREATACESSSGRPARARDHPPPPPLGMVLRELPLPFQSGDLDAEPDDRLEHRLDVGGRLVEGPGLGPRALVGRDRPAEDVQQAVAVLDEVEGAVGVDGDIVPGRDGPLLLVPGRRDVSVRPGEDGQDLALGRPATAGWPWPCARAGARAGRRRRRAAGAGGWRTGRPRRARSARRSCAARMNACSLAGSDSAKAAGTYMARLLRHGLTEQSRSSGRYQPPPRRPSADLTPCERHRFSRGSSTTYRCPAPRRRNRHSGSTS